MREIVLKNSRSYRSDGFIVLTRKTSYSDSIEYLVKTKMTSRGHDIDTCEWSKDIYEASSIPIESIFTLYTQFVYADKENEWGDEYQIVVVG